MMNQPLRIMVVEDEVLIAMCLELELETAGYTLCGRVTSGEDAITAAERERPDVILMDIQLAGAIDGIEAARQIQTLTATPIIFMTGYPDKDVVDRASQLNPSGFFNKPIRIADIQIALDKIR